MPMGSGAGTGTHAQQNGGTAILRMSEERRTSSLLSLSPGARAPRRAARHSVAAQTAPPSRFQPLGTRHSPTWVRGECRVAPRLP